MSLQRAQQGEQCHVLMHVGEVAGHEARALGQLALDISVVVLGRGVLVAGHQFTLGVKRIT